MVVLGSIICTAVQGYTQVYIIFIKFIRIKDEKYKEHPSVETQYSSIAPLITAAKTTIQITQI